MLQDDDSQIEKHRDLEGASSLDKAYVRSPDAYNTSPYAYQQNPQAHDQRTARRPVVDRIADDQKYIEAVALRAHTGEDDEAQVYTLYIGLNGALATLDFVTNGPPTVV